MQEDNYSIPPSECSSLPPMATSPPNPQAKDSDLNVSTIQITSQNLPTESTEGTPTNSVPNANFGHSPIHGSHQDTTLPSSILQQEPLQPNPQTTLPTVSALTQTRFSDQWLNIAKSPKRTKSRKRQDSQPKKLSRIKAAANYFSVLDDQHNSKMSELDPKTLSIGHNVDTEITDDKKSQDSTRTHATSKEVTELPPDPRPH